MEPRAPAVLVRRYAHRASRMCPLQPLPSPSITPIPRGARTRLFDDRYLYNPPVSPSPSLQTAPPFARSLVLSRPSAAQPTLVRHLPECRTPAIPCIARAHAKHSFDPQLRRLLAWPECAATYSDQERARDWPGLCRLPARLGLTCAPALLPPNARLSSTTTSAHQPREAAQHRQDLPSRVTRIPPRRPKHRPPISTTHHRDPARRLSRPRRSNCNPGYAPKRKQNVSPYNDMDLGIPACGITTSRRRFGTRSVCPAHQHPPRNPRPSPALRPILT